LLWCNFIFSYGKTITSLERSGNKAQG
jgi:hypothetical protein